LREAGVSCARIYSPASELDPDGVPYCKYAKSAKHLAHGFMSVPKDFCQGRGHDPCQYLQTCPAASGLEGNDTATVTVGNHGLLSVLVRSAGKTGLRIIDEPQTLLTTHSITGIDLAAAQQLAYSFDLELGEIMRECLRLLQMIVVDNTDMNATEIEHVIGKKLVDRAIAVQTEHQFVAPPVPWTLVRQAREQPVTAARLSTASRCVWIIWRAIITDAKWLLRRENRGRTPTLLLTGPDEQFVGALLSEGATVVIDASPDVEVLSRACGYNVGGSRLSTVTARDGAPIERTLIQWSRGNRTALLPSGTPAIPLFLIGLRKVVDWCLEDPTCRTIGLITLMPFHALYDTDEAFRTQVAEVTKPWNGQILWGHFGAIRGLDDWKHCDALVTLGDPWSNVGDVANDAAFLELKDPENRAEWLAARELEQAHGRLRAPHRTVSGRALHVGRVAPLGWSTVEVDVRLSVNGRPKNRSAVTPSDLRDWIKTTCGGSVSAAARELMCGKSTLHRYLCGEINVPAAIAAYIR
jgi:hypothetical protein